jgi:hypothetical protein
VSVKPLRNLLSVVRSPPTFFHEGVSVFFANEPAIMAFENELGVLAFVFGGIVGKGSNDGELVRFGLHVVDEAAFYCEIVQLPMPRFLAPGKAFGGDEVEHAVLIRIGDSDVANPRNHEGHVLLKRNANQLRRKDGFKIWLRGSVALLTFNVDESLKHLGEVDTRVFGKHHARCSEDHAIGFATRKERESFGRCQVSLRMNKAIANRLFGKKPLVFVIVIPLINALHLDLHRSPKTTDLNRSRGIGPKSDLPHPASTSLAHLHR